MRRALDLFCGAGGASKGLADAGFDMTGIDIAPQPNYPYGFVQADALRPPVQLTQFDLVWASPPCQAHSLSRNNGSHRDAPDLLPTTRKMLMSADVAYIIENVPGAPMPSGIQLCGASFGLKAGDLDLPRHRWFETSFGFLAPPCQHRRGKTIGVYGNGTNAQHRRLLGRCLTEREKREAMGIDWMTRRELTQAVPPAYATYLAEQFLAL